MDCSVEQLDALADAEEAEPARAGGWVEPVAVVAHGELNRVGVLEDFDHRPVGVAVLGGVGERLLGDPVERSFELGGVSRRLAASFVCELDRAVDLETVPARAFAEGGERGLEAE